MNFFKNLFSSTNKVNKPKENKLDLERLLNSGNKNNSIIEIDNFIGNLCGWGESLENITEPQKNFFFIQNLEREVNMGGFRQYFGNSSGDFSHETIESLKVIGAEKTAAKLQKAIDQFPNKTVPKDRIKRQHIIENIEEKTKEIWDDLDQKFFVYEDDLNTLNIEYIRQNKEKF